MAAQAEFHPSQAPVLVLLPGMDGTGALFEPFVQCWPGETKVISYPEDESLSYLELADMVISQLPDAPLILVAESFSGEVARRVAKKMNSHRIKGLVFAASFLSSPRPFLLRWARRLPTWLFKWTMPASLARLGLLGLQASVDAVGSFRAALSQGNPAVLKDRLTMISSLKAEAWQFSGPILCLQASQDRLVPQNCISDFRLVNENLVVSRIDGPHLLLQTRARACAHAIQHFLADSGLLEPKGRPKDQCAEKQG